MTSPPAWYPDSQHPGQQRYWDGQRWTDHVAPAQRHVEYGGGYGGPPTTPDGQQLAGWWQRVGAQLIDGLIVFPISVVAALPFWLHLVDAYGDYFRESMDATEAGRSGPSAASLQTENFGSLAGIGLIALLVSFVYVVGFLSWKQATPGKLALGLRVRLRERPGPLPFRAILLRWVAQSAVGLVGLVPYAGSLSGLYVWLDGLWPLWDGKKQALHDKVAGTNVVLKDPRS